MPRRQVRLGAACLFTVAVVTVTGPQWSHEKAIKCLGAGLRASGLPVPAGPIATLRPSRGSAAGSRLPGGVEFGPSASPLLPGSAERPGTRCQARCPDQDEVRVEVAADRASAGGLGPVSVRGGACPSPRRAGRGSARAGWRRQSTWRWPRGVSAPSGGGGGLQNRRLEKCPSVLPAGRRAEQPRHAPGTSLPSPLGGREAAWPLTRPGELPGVSGSEVALRGGAAGRGPGPVWVPAGHPRKLGAQPLWSVEGR